MSGLVASSSSSSSSSSRRSVAVISKPQRSFDYSSVVNRRKSWHTKDILYLNVLITRQEMARLLDKHATTRRALRRLNIAAVYSACTCRGTYIHMSSIRIPSAILLTCCQFSSVCEKYTRSDTIAENVRTRIPRSRSNYRINAPGLTCGSCSPSFSLLNYVHRAFLRALFNRLRRIGRTRRRTRKNSPLLPFRIHLGCGFSLKISKACVPNVKSE